MDGYFELLHHDGKTKEELIENVVVEKTNSHDFYEIIDIVAKTFETVGYHEFKYQFYNIVEDELIQTKADLNESIKLVDKRDNKIYGLIVFSHFPISQGSPILANKNTRPIGEYLNNFTQINGFAFVIDKRLRGCGFDKKMIEMATPFMNQYDFIWVATGAENKANKYYEYLGGFEIFRTNEAVFYIKNMAKSNMNDVFILRLLANMKENEKNNT